MPRGIFKHKPTQGFQKGNKPIAGFKKGNKINLGRKHSKKTREKRSEALKGNTNGFQKGQRPWNWKDGTTPLKNLIRSHYKNRLWRSDVFTRDDFTCQNCGKRGGDLEADHYPKSFAKIFYENKIKTLEEALNCEEFWNINNGRTLCRECHKLIN